MTNSQTSARPTSAGAGTRLRSPENGSFSPAMGAVTKHAPASFDVG